MNFNMTLTAVVTKTDAFSLGFIPRRPGYSRTTLYVTDGIDSEGRRDGDEDGKAKGREIKDWRVLKFVQW
jgi:hypothetical protein